MFLCQMAVFSGVTISRNARSQQEFRPQTSKHFFFPGLQAVLKASVPVEVSCVILNRLLIQNRTLAASYFFFAWLFSQLKVRKKKIKVVFPSAG